MISNIFTMLVDLLNNPKCTAQELASKLEISERTVYRYVDVLSFAHVPVVCKKGRDGGIMIGEDFKLRAQYLTREELELIFTSLDTLPFNDTAVGIKAKLQNINTDKRTDENFHSDLFVVDKSTWGNNTNLQQKMDALLKARSRKKAVKITYHDRGGNLSERVIEPYVVVYGAGIWYIYAWCRMRNQMRTFKISRITHILPTDSDFKPREFTNAWKIANKLDNAQEISIVLKVNQNARYDVEEWLGVEAVNKAEQGDYWIAQAYVTVGDKLIDKLLSYRENIEVLSPISIRDKVKVSAMSIAKLYK